MPNISSSFAEQVNFTRYDNQQCGHYESPDQRDSQEGKLK